MGGQTIATRVLGDPTATNNGLFYTFSDHLGNTSVLATSSGNQVPGSPAGYYPFGSPRTTPTQTITDRNFAGQKENMELGLIYYNARYYLPTIGRFASADTIVPDPAGPQQFNRYAYAYTLNNLTNFTDPSGHRTCTAQQAATGDETCNQNINDNDPGYLGNGYESITETATNVQLATLSLYDENPLPSLMATIVYTQAVQNLPAIRANLLEAQNTYDYSDPAFRADSSPFGQ